MATLPPRHTGYEDPTQTPSAIHPVEHDIRHALRVLRENEQPSRGNSLAVTKLEEALFWFKIHTGEFRTS